MKLSPNMTAWYALQKSFFEELRKHHELTEILDRKAGDNWRDGLIAMDEITAILANEID